MRICLLQRVVKPVSVIAFVNLKGGCCKSTSAVHCCRDLLGKGFSVSLLDTDVQATSSKWINSLKKGIPRPEICRLIEPDSILDRLPELAGQYDFVVVDGAGGLAEVQRAILLLADVVMIPLQATMPDLSASYEAIKAVGRARQIRKGAPVAFTFLTKVFPRTVLLRETREALAEQQDIPLLAAEIPHRQIAADAMGQGITLFDIKGNRGATEVARQYKSLFEEAQLCQNAES